MKSDLLTTTEAAEILHCSRQHVVHLCERGVLTYTRAGNRRRILRSDVETLASPPLRREDERSLWLNVALAARLLLDPVNVIERAKVRLQRLRASHSDGSSDKWFDRWQAALDDGPHAVLAIMTGRSEEAATLRSASPISGLGLLTENERAQVLAAFNTHWRSTHQRWAA